MEAAEVLYADGQWAERLVLDGLSDGAQRTLRVLVEELETSVLRPLSSARPPAPGDATAHAALDRFLRWYEQVGRRVGIDFVRRLAHRLEGSLEDQADDARDTDEHAMEIALRALARAQREVLPHTGPLLEFAARTAQIPSAEIPPSAKQVISSRLWCELTLLVVLASRAESSAELRQAWRGALASAAMALEAALDANPRWAVELARLAQFYLRPRRVMVPDVVVVAPTTGSPLLLCEVKAAAPNALVAKAEQALQQQMLDRRCELGALVTSQVVRIYRDTYSSYERASVALVDEFPFEGMTARAGAGSPSEIEDAVSAWLEEVCAGVNSAADERSRRIVSELLVPHLRGGEVLRNPR